MSWFDEQIRQRRKNDNDAISSAFERMAKSVLGSTAYSIEEDDDEINTDTAICQIMRAFHIKPRPVPKGLTSIEEQLEHLFPPHGIMKRHVMLEKGWYRDSFGIMLGFMKSDGSAVALIPRGISGYCYYDRKLRKYKRINKKNEALLEQRAFLFYRPFPTGKIDHVKLRKFIFSIPSTADYIAMLAVAVAVTLLGTAMPKLVNIITGSVVENEKISAAIAMMIFMASILVSQGIMTMVNNLLINRLKTKITVTMHSALVMRMLSLPSSFFEEHNSGELANRIKQVETFSEAVVTSVMFGGVTTVLSFVYYIQICIYATTPLALAALLVIIAIMLFSIFSALSQVYYTKEQFSYYAEHAGISYELFARIRKIKLSGSEKRAFARWGEIYAKGLDATYNASNIIKYNPSIVLLLLSNIGLVVMYFLSAKSGMSTSNYYAFNVAYGSISGVLSNFATVASSAALIKPILNIISPFFDAAPEIAEKKRIITRLNGNIELSHLSFKYIKSKPNVVDDISLKIRAGEYVAIVGSTGCGKSTLLKLLLGFETPQKGAIYYDGRDLADLDMASVRRRIGVVLQEGKLFSGDIFSNIAMFAPGLTMEGAWEAAELADIADSIRRMPKGMNTLVGSSSISIGERQRIMIACAIAAKPDILMFDEATSALDNISQKKISNALDALKCTRIVIAHRLSTIKQCDRIIYLEKGHIVEDGTYSELLALNGKFAELVERQRIYT